MWRYLPACDPSRGWQCDTPIYPRKAESSTLLVPLQLIEPGLTSLGTQTTPVLTVRVATTEMEYRDSKTRSSEVGRTIERLEHLKENNLIRDDPFLSRWLTICLEDYDEVMFFRGILEDISLYDTGNNSIRCCLIRLDRMFGDVWRVVRLEEDTLTKIVAVLQEDNLEASRRRSGKGQNPVISSLNNTLRDLMEQRTTVSSRCCVYIAIRSVHVSAQDSSLLMIN
jgi:hypothetical protein